MKYAVIIKHPYRDYDYRVDIVDVDESTTKEEIYKAIMAKMLGPFEIFYITEKVDLDRDISQTLERIRRDSENHIET